MKGRFLILLLMLSGFTSDLLAQRTVTVKQAGSLGLVVIDGQKTQKLKNDVWLIHENTHIRCDSAYFFEATNSAKAFGHVTIVDQVDQLDLKGDYLEYDGNTRLAKVRQNVIMKDDSIDLYTDYLDFDRNSQIGHYYNGGKLVDSTNVLTSSRGYYNTNTKEAQFIDSVHLNSPDYEVYSDTVNYSTLSKVVLTRGHTEAFSVEGDTLRTEHGLKYDSQKKYSELYYGQINTPEYEIKADSLIANDSTKYYQGDHNVQMTSYTDSVTIFGEHMRYEKSKGVARVFEDAYLRKMIQFDSLFIKGDTLVSVQDTVNNQKYLTAYKGVKMFKSDLQGEADSVSYNFSDSTIYMYQSPVIWNIDSQINADSINIQIANNKIHRMNLALNSFVITQDTLKNFNQVKGRNMLIHFEDGFIKRADVNGNGESIYFANDGNDDASSMNKLECSNMAIYFVNNAVTELRTYRDIDGNFVPPIEIKEPDTKLRGFDWREEDKPKLLDIAKHLRPKAQEASKKKPEKPVKKG